MNSSIYEIAVFPLLQLNMLLFVCLAVFHAVSPYHRIISKKRSDTATQRHKQNAYGSKYLSIYYIIYIIL